MATTAIHYSIKTCPLWKWILLFIGAIILSAFCYALLMSGFQLSFQFMHPSLTIVCAAITLGLYALSVRLLERHWPTDLNLRRFIPHTLLGLIIGFIYMTLVVCTISAMGCASVEWNSFVGEKQFSVLMMYLAVAVGEEIICRGIIFRWIDERWNTWLALLISALFFGWMHISNDNATWWSSLAIAIEAGLMIGIAYKWSGTLWVPIGLHWAWNYTQGNIFGLAVSGANVGDTILVTTVNGPDIITGGAFGPEASIIAVAFGVILTIVFLTNRFRR